MSTYRTVTRMTDSGPYIIKLILNLGCEVGQNDLSPEVFNVHVIRREKNGDVLMQTEHGAEVALPSVGYVTVKAAYPCDENGSFLPRGSYAALEQEDRGQRPLQPVCSELFPCHPAETLSSAGSGQTGNHWSGL